MGFSEKLKAERKAVGLSQEKLAIALGVTKRTIINYEQGRTVPSLTLMQKLSKCFDLPVTELVAESEEGPAKSDDAKGARAASRLVADAAALFAGGGMSDEDKDAVMRALQEAYWAAKGVQ